MRFYEADGFCSLYDQRHIGQPLVGHTSSVSSVAFSQDGKILASGSADNTIIVWDVASHQPIGQPITVHTGSVNSVAFSPDGKTLASGSYDQTIILWDVLTHQPIGQPLNGHTATISSVAFSPDGKTLASGSQDDTIILWDIVTHQPIGQPLTGHTSSVNSVAFSPDGKTLASGSYDQTIILWDINPQDWIKQSCQRVGRNFTRVEWAQYFHGEAYRKTCPQWPLEAEDRAIASVTKPSFPPTLFPTALPNAMETLEIFATGTSSAQKNLSAYPTSTLVMPLSASTLVSQ